MCRYILRSIVAMLIIGALSSCGGGNQTTEPTSEKLPNTPPSAVEIDSALSFKSSRVILEWVSEQRSVIYEIHASKDKAFVPNSTTLVAEVFDTQTAEVEDLEPGQTYFFRLRVRRAGTIAIDSNDVIEVAVAKTDPEFYPLSNFTLDTNIGLSPISVTAGSILYSASQNFVLPQINAILVGRDPSDDGRGYLRRVTGSKINTDQTVTIYVDAVDIFDTFQRAEINYSLRGVVKSLNSGIALGRPTNQMQRLSDEKANSFNASTVCEKQVVGTSTLSSLIPTVSTEGFNATMNARLEIPEEAEPLIQFSIVIPWKVTLNSTYQMGGAIDIDCTRDLIPVPLRALNFVIPGPFGIPIPLVVSGEASFGLFVRIRANGSLKGFAEYRLSDVSSAEVTIRPSTGVVPTANFSPQLNQDISIQPDQATLYGGQIFGGPRFVISPQIGIGAKVKDFEAGVFRKFLTYGVEGGPTFNLATKRNKGFVKDIQPISIDTYELGLRADLFARIELADALKRLLRLNSNLELRTENLAGRYIVSSATLETEMTELAARSNPNWSDVNVSIEQKSRFDSTVYEILSKTEPHSIDWHFAPNTPESVDLTSLKGAVKGTFLAKEVGCLAVSGEDSLLKLRRFSSPIKFGPTTIVDFQNYSSLPFFLDPYFVETTDSKVTIDNGQARRTKAYELPDSVFASNMLKITRKDERPFFMDSFTVFISSQLTSDDSEYLKFLTSLPSTVEISGNRVDELTGLDTWFTRFIEIPTDSAAGTVVRLGDSLGKIKSLHISIALPLFINIRLQGNVTIKLDDIFLGQRIDCTE
jgi:hypothetical protein